MRQGLIDGMLGILTNDMKLEKKIRRLSTFLGLNNQVVFSLMNLKSSLAYQTVQGVTELSKLGGVSEQAGLYAGLISLMRGEVSYLNTLAKHFGNAMTVTAALGCAVRGIAGVKETLPELCKVFEIDNWRIIQTVLRICHGNTEEVQRVATRKNHHFFIQNIPVAEALLYVTHTGREIAYGRAPDKQHLSGALHVLFMQLELAFGVRQSDKKNAQDDFNLADLEGDDDE